MEFFPQNTDIDAIVFETPYYLEKMQRNSMYCSTVKELQILSFTLDLFSSSLILMSSIM